jgi:hypothetical protein
MRTILGKSLTALALAATSLTAAPAPAGADDADLWPAPFEYCPAGVVSNPETGGTTTTCVAAVGYGGTFKLGKTVVTLTDGVNFQGGLGPVPGGFGFVLANDGMTLSGPDQSVPGGVLGIALIENLLPGITDIKAEVRLVGQPDFRLGQDLSLTLPVQVRLKNLLLGPKCAIGSAEDPITLRLTTGTTTPPEGVEPITGTPGQITAPPLGTTVLEFVGQTIVDNTFAVPRAHGCGALGILNRIVDLKAGLPAAPGVSHASLVTNTFVVAAADVDKVSGYVPGM